MVRLRSTILVIAAMAAPLSPLVAQVPTEVRPQPMAADHTVVRGETLWALAGRYLDNSYAWPSIHDLNRAIVPNPHLIYPGQTLRIPGLMATAEVVSGVAVLPAEGQPMAPTILSRGQLSGEGGPARSGSSVFGMRQERAGGVVVQRADTPRTAVPRDIFLQAGWIAPVDEETTPDHAGVISGFEGVAARTGTRTTASLYSEVRITVTGDRTPGPGTVLLAFRPAEMVPEEGRIVHPTGLLVVDRVDEGGVVARVERMFDRVLIEDLVTVAPTHPERVGVHPAPVSNGMDATIIAFARSHALHIRGDVAYLDVGTANGVTVGDEFVAVAAREDEWAGTEAGRLQVIGVRDRTAAVRILSQDGAIFRAGIPVRLAGKMP